MPTVDVSRFVPATPAELRRRLDPASVVAYEGTYSVTDVEETGDGWLVSATARGIGAELAFEEREDGFVYEQVRGPLERMRTELSFAPENEGARVTMTSTVDAGLPLSRFTAPLTAWKRKGELKRALAALADDVS
ncbi:SRPBCC family protein [Halobacteriaceae archaeon GCM10025711]